MDEYKFIESVSSLHKTSQNQINRTWESDSEIIRFNDRYLAVSTDSFSENEDFFQYTQPEIIGRNICWGLLSDLCACGVSPQYIVQSWNLDSKFSGEYYKTIASGIESTLLHFNAHSLGGDVGCSVPWLWNGTAFGFSDKTPVMRRAIQKKPFKLYATGAFGDANLAFVSHSSMPIFECRQPVPDAALFGTDSSGGFFDAIENIRRVNPDLNLTIELDKIPYSATVMGIPPEFLLIGGVGEYELIFALPENIEPPSDVSCIGYGDFSKPVVTLTRSGKKIGAMKSAPPDFRSIAPEKYLETVQNWYGELFV